MARAARGAEELSRTSAELLLLVAQRKRHGCIVLTFADNRWLDMLLNWMVNLHEVRSTREKCAEEGPCSACFRRVYTSTCV